MASIQYVVNAVDAASGVFARIAASADGLDKQLADLSRRVATPQVDLNDAKFTLGMINAAKRLDKLSEMVADPSVEVDTAKAQTEILRITAMLDRLDAKRVKVDAGVSGGFVSRLLGSAGGAGGAGGSGVLGAASGLPGGIGAVAAAGPVPLAAAAGAALTALPFIAQAAAGAITFTLGGALTGLAILSASSAKRVKADWTGLFGNAGAEMRQVVQPFVGALKQISQVGQSVLPTIMMSLVQPMKILAPAFKTVADSLLRSFAQPAVQSAILAVANAFAQLLKALAPQIPGDIQAVADGIANIARAVSRNPKAFADFVSFFFHLAGAVLDAIGWLTQIADVIEMKVIPNMVKGFGQMGHIISQDFDAMRHDAAQIWDGMWQDTIGKVQTGVATVERWFRTLPAGVRTALAGLGQMLLGIGTGSMTELWNGFKSVGTSILHWLGGFLNSLIGLAKKILGVFSPSSVFFDIGKNMMLGLEGGIKAHAQSAVSAARSAAQAAAGGARGGVAGPGGGAPAANAALARRMMPAWGSGAEWAAWNAVAMAESGWNQFARNPSSGAYGIPQALPPGKMGAAANPPQSNPAAQISWMIGYIRSVYGDPIRAWQHEQAFHWYDYGGWLPPGASLAVNQTGQPERVTSPAQESAQLAILKRIEKLLQSAPERTGGALGDALNGRARGARYSGMYSARGA